MAPPAADTVRTLRAHLAPGTPHGDALRWRLRLERAVGGADLRPPGLAPQAVFLVRRVVARVPEQAAQPAAVASRVAWERAVRAHLAERLHAAARPLRGRLPPEAEAVVFADRAEWLACVLLDRARGGIPAWWWPERLRSPGTDEGAAGIGGALREEVLHVPAVVAYLAAWDAAAALVRVLPPSEAQAVLAAVAATLAPELGTAAANATAAREGCPSPEGQEHDALGREVEVWVRHGLSASVLVTGAQTHRVLFTVALALARRPSWVRRGGLRHGIIAPIVERLAEQARGDTTPLHRRPLRRRWSGAHEQGEAPGTPAEVETGGVDVEARQRPGSAEAEPLGVAQPVGGGDAAAASQRAPEPERLRDRYRTGAERAASPGEAEARAARPKRSPWREAEAFVEGAERAGRHPIHAEENGGARLPDAPQEPAVASSEVGIATRLGGVLYLLNLFAALDVPGAFAAWCRTDAPGPWALLDLIARGLLDGEADLLDDPLWRLLAFLGGREGGAPPGTGVAGGTGVLLPSTWVSDLDAPEATWGWAARRGWLAVWNEQGVPVALAPQDGVPSAQARVVLHLLGVSPPPLRRRPFHAAPLVRFAGSLAAAVPGGVRPWLAVVVPFLRWRLEQALGPDCSVEALLTVPGRIYLTSSHLDLVQPLDALPFAVRRAGLDRDPGWLPDVGRVVLFHFEGRETVLA